MSDERREYFRVNCEAIVRFSSIAQADERAATHSFHLGAADGFTLATRFAAASRETEALFKRVAAQHPDVASYLSSLDHKIDVMARLLLKTQMDELPPLIRVELSASGIGFETREMMEPGGLSSLRLVLLPQYTGVEMLARIVHCSAKEGEHYWVGAEFEHVRDADREVLIQYVLDRQSVDLRDRKRAVEAG